MVQPVTTNMKGLECPSKLDTFIFVIQRVIHAGLLLTSKLGGKEIAPHKESCLVATVQLEMAYYPTTCKAGPHRQPRITCLVYT